MPTWAFLGPDVCAGLSVGLKHVQLISPQPYIGHWAAEAQLGVVAFECEHFGGPLKDVVGGHGVAGLGFEAVAVGAAIHLRQAAFLDRALGGGLGGGRFSHGAGALVQAG